MRLNEDNPAFHVPFPTPFTLEFANLFGPHKRKLSVAEKDMLESVVEKAGCSYAARKGWRVRKLTNPGNRSAPDRIHWGAGGRCFTIEYKRPGKVATEKQLHEQKSLISLGYHSYVVDCKEMAFAVIDFETWVRDEACGHA